MNEINIELHAHPIGLRKYGLETIVKIAKKNNLDCVALEDYNNYIFPELKEMSKRLDGKYRIVSNDEVIRIADEKKSVYILNASELMTEEKFHIITLGKTCSKEGDKIDNILKSDFLTIIDHPLVDAEKSWKEIGQDKKKTLTHICANYADKIALEWNSYCKDWIWNSFLGGDINEKTEIWSYRYNIPLVADTDLHGWNEKLMNDLGKSRIMIPLENLDFNLNYLIPSIKKAIADKKHENVKNYVPLMHFAEAFGFPIIASKFCNSIYKHARGKIKEN